MYSRQDLITPTQSLLKAFATGADLPTLLSTFTTSPPPQAHEHGLQSLAPFLGRTFTGRDGITNYFNILNELLGIESMDFDDEKEWVVDAENLTVALRGKARFVAKETGEKWDETFAYRISLAEDEGEKGRGGGLRVRVYEVWADTGAAYLARKGQLNKVHGEGE
ncbi:hypothetical protein BJX68DRAFT_261431 [Aspergillus pseudodeflectus]|uniref:SnoaL-like domain-containing protein n=1 Tax=Aspergillus pseudodeflectus TaxID=176178 RepID=A0ABR4L7J7_9EURO